MSRSLVLLLASTAAHLLLLCHDASAQNPVELSPVDVQARKPQAQRRPAARRPVQATRANAARRPRGAVAARVQSPPPPPAAPSSFRTPSTGIVGAPPAPYPGGQVGSGSRLGFLGNRDVFDQPFSSTSYTEKLIRDQQARNVQDVLNNDPSIRQNVPSYSGILGFFVRGFPVFAQDIAFNGLFGVADNFNPAIEQVERVEVLRGPSTLLSGIPPFGNIGGVINLVPKRAGDEDLNRVTIGYGSDGQAYQSVDVSRRAGANKEWGIRFNGALNNGATPIDLQSTRYGIASLALDYRGERFRAAVDLGYQELDFNAPLRNRSVLPGFRIPRAPDLTINQHQPFEYRDSSNKMGAVRAEYDIADNLTIYGAYGRSNFHQEYFGSVLTIFNQRGDYRDPVNFLPLRVDNETGEIGVRGTFMTGPVKHSFGAAATGFYQDLSQKAAVNVGPQITSNLYAPIYVAPRSAIGLSDSTPRTSARNNSSVAVADTMSILDDRVQLTLGGRVQEILVNSYSATTGFRTGSSDSRAFSPGVGLVVKPVERLSLYANYIEGLTSPAPPVTAANANAAFPAVVSRQAEVGAKYDFGPVGVGFAAFQIEQPFGFLNPAINIFSVDGRQRNSGVEMTVFGEPIAGLRLLGGVSLIDGTQVRTQDPRNVGRVAVGVPDVQLNLYAEYDLPPWLLPGVSLTGRVIHTASQYYDLANTQKIPDWTTLDLGVRYTTRVYERPVTLRANVLNATGLNYWASTGRGVLAQGSPRTFLLSATVDF